MGRGNSSDDTGFAGRRENGVDLNEIAERARQLLPRYGGFASGAVNQAFILAGHPASKEQQQQVEQMLNEHPDAR